MSADSVRVMTLVIVTDTAKPIAARSATIWPSSICEVPGLTMSRYAEKAERDGRELEAGELLAEEQSGDDRAPDRHGEFDRDDLGQRDEDQCQEPGILRAVMDDIADDIEADIGEAPLEAA